jgi:hypothetical protein
MEDDRSEPEGASQENSFHYQMMLSELWVGAVYEIFRLLTERSLAPPNNEFKILNNELRLLRIPIEKHQIAKDNKLSRPLFMKKFPLKNDETDVYQYSRGDPQRAHIMPTGISHRGSAMWQVIDIESGPSYWLERRDLSERIVGLWKSAVAADVPVSQSESATAI